MAVKISASLPNCREGRINPIGSVHLDWMLRTARLADELGYYSVWLNEFLVTEPRVAGLYADPPSLFDPIVTMAYAAAATKRVRFMPSTIVLPYYEPILLSRELATLDVFSGGRISLGIGLGSKPEEYQQLRGTLKKVNRGKMIDEIVPALQGLWTERYATFEGEYVKFKDAETYPKPLQNPLPIFMAGHAEGVFRRLAAHGHGWIDSNLMADDMRTNVDRLYRYAEEAGRGNVKFEVARQFYASLASTTEEAKANYAASVPPPTKPQSPGGGAAAATASQERNLIGTPEFFRERVKEYIAAGVTEICLIFYAPDAEATERQLRLCASEVMPAFTD